MLTRPIRILLVTPNKKWRSDLGKYLAQNGFELAGEVDNASSAVTLLRRSQADLVVVDSQLPDVDGLIFCHFIQVLHPTIKVVLAAKDHDVALQLSAAQAKASGCISCDLPLTQWASLLVYVYNGRLAFDQAILKAAISGTSFTKNGATSITIGPLIIDFDCRLVTLFGESVYLTPREFSVLTCLAHNKGRVVTFDQLLDEAWGYDSEMGTSGQVRVYVNRLRQKLVNHHQVPEFIVSERGIGYRLLSQEQWHQKVNHNLSNIFKVPQLSRVGLPVILSYHGSQTEIASIEKNKAAAIHHFLEQLHNMGERIWHNAHASLVDELWLSYLSRLHQLENEVIAYGYEVLMVINKLPLLFLEDLAVKYASHI